jgi:hypothetical protein
MQTLETTGLTEVIESWEVSNRTAQGYKVICIFQETHHTKETCQIPHPSPSYNGENAYRDEIIQNTTTKFIVTLDEESSLGMLNHTIKSQDENIKKLTQAKNDAETQFKEATAERDKARTEAGNYQDKWSRKVDEYHKLLDVKRKMEKDIGKIREAIGTQQMKEILNDGAVSAV